MELCVGTGGMPSSKAPSSPSWWTLMQKSSGWVCNKSFSQTTSIVVDGTTDSSVSDAEIIYIRYTSTLLALENSFTGLGRL